jgi:membrane-associated phospholipid phosphatase
MQLPDDVAGEERIGDRDLARWHSRAGQGLARLAIRLGRQISAHAVLYLTAGIGGVLVLGLTAAGAGVYDSVVDHNGLASFDRPTLNTATRLRTATNDRLLTWFTHLGGPVGMTVIAVCVTTVMVLLWRSRTPLILMVIAVAGSLAMTIIGKLVFARARPPIADAVPPYETSPSLPSGHALNSTVIAGMIAYLILRRLESRAARMVTIAAAITWAVAMGLSRVFLGHHWLTDVVFGWILGLAWLAVVVTAHRLFLTVRRSRHTQGAPTGPEGDTARESRIS